MYKLVVLRSSFGLFLPIFSVMMPASLLRKRTKTSPKYEQTGATSFFIITKIPGSRARLRGFLIILLYCFSFYLRPAPLLPPLTDPRELELLEDELELLMDERLELLLEELLEELEELLLYVERDELLLEEVEGRVDLVDVAELLELLDDVER